MIELKMKKVLLLLLMILSSVPLFGQTMDAYFYAKGVETLAELAHPTNTFVRGLYRVEPTKVWADIYYKDGYRTTVEVTREGHFFTGINVLFDNDWVSPFFMVSSIKNIALSMITDDSDKRRTSVFEEKIDKTLQEMDGRDIACLILTLGWLEY